MDALFLGEERLVHSFDLLWSKGSKVGIGWDDLLGESDVFNGAITGVTRPNSRSYGNVTRTHTRNIRP